MTAREWGTTLSHLLTGDEGWTVYDRLLVLALSQHDMDLCPSGAGPEHYRDQCDADTTDIEAVPVETTCVYLVAREEWEEERQQDKHPEKGVLVGFKDDAAPSGPVLHRSGDQRDHGQAEARNAQDREQRDLYDGAREDPEESGDHQQ